MRSIAHVTVLTPSPYPSYNAPLMVQGDALILPDLEAPFHHSQFVNKCCKLASAWNIQNLVLAGDAVHWASLSSWGAEWAGNLPRPHDDAMLDFMTGLDEASRERGIELLEQMGVIRNDESVPGEIANVRVTLRAFNQQFQTIYWVLGNHENRLLRKLQASLSTTDLLLLTSVGDKWKSAPYYYCLVYSGGEEFRITHPYTTANKGPAQIASRKSMHVIMAHSHKWMKEHDPSGQYWAIHSGHCCDEGLMSYVSSRDSGGYDAHCLGATIIKDGYPWLLSDNAPWDMLMRMK